MAREIVKILDTRDDKFYLQDLYKKRSRDNLHEIKDTIKKVVKEAILKGKTGCDIPVARPLVPLFNFSSFKKGEADTKYFTLIFSDDRGDIYIHKDDLNIYNYITKELDIKVVRYNRRKDSHSLVYFDHFPIDDGMIFSWEHWSKK